MRKSRIGVLLAVAAALASASAPGLAFDLAKVTARVRAIRIDPADKSDPIAALAVPQDAIDVSNKWAPDIDFEYAFTDRFAVELLLTIPQKHSVIARETALGPNVRLGTVTHLPPTLTGKYYFATGSVRPYLGAGINLTWFTQDRLAVAGVGSLDIDNLSVGPALQAGVDFDLGNRWSISIDVKKAWISTDVSLGGTKLTTVDVDPYILGIGAGYRFGAN
ncbi:MAG: OmpW family outer membrane protein [Steroidobacteraceae bacterium]